MKTRTILFAVVSLFLLTAGMGCEKNKGYTPPSDPKLAILGKWELVEEGVWPPDGQPHKPTYYWEFLPDSIFRWFDYDTNEYLPSVEGDVYWIDSLLYIKNRNVLAAEAYMKCYYEFYDDKMLLERADILTLVRSYFIYQRKK